MEQERENIPAGSWYETYALWVAQGFGVGRIPFAPGTWGSVIGLLWFALLVQSGRAWIYLAGTCAGLGLAVWLCGLGEKILRQKDPGSVVLDEIAAVPVCFLVLVLAPWIRAGHWPQVENFFSGSGWWHIIFVFLLFRIFDVLKPWPVGRSQKLPGGWGVVADDFLAGIYVALVSLVLVV